MQHQYTELIHLANILYLASYTVRDILWLRILSVLGMLSLSWCYYACAVEDPMWWSALYWQFAFISINLIQIGILLFERWPVRLSTAERELHQGPLKPFTPKQVQKFCKQAQWCTVSTGELLLRENQTLEKLTLLLSGEARVIAQGNEVARLSAGQFAGEMSFLTGEKTSANVVADGTVLCAQWPPDYVRDITQRDRELGTALQSAIGADLVKKVLKGQAATVSELSQV